MSAKKKINQRTRLLIWRAVRRKVKMAIDLPPHRRSSEGLCNFLWNETTSRGLTLNEFPSNLAKKYFPELLPYNPHRDSAFWWPLTEAGDRERLKVCNEIIKKLEYKNNCKKFFRFAESTYICFLKP